jgi:hypothetical protein
MAPNPTTSCPKRAIDISLVDPKQIAPALHTGYDRARTEADRIKQFWA